MNNFQFPYEKVISFLNSLDEEQLKSLYDKYNTSDVRQLADMVSDEDLLILGYNTTEDEQNDSIYYQYSDVDNVIKFLSTIDRDILEYYMNHYNCNELSDLALALTDSELSDLGYKGEIIDESLDDYDDELEDYGDNEEYYDMYSDYDENQDYLEDIPSNIKYYVLDKNNHIYAVDTEYDYYNFKNNLDPLLIDSCEVCENYSDISNKVVFNVTPHQYEISEEVVINDELNPEIFDSEHKMLPEVRDQILEYVNTFTEKMSQQDVNIDYTDVTLVGSNAGYLYTPTSDIDIHLISAYQIDLNDAENLFNEFDLFEAENPLFINNSKVELGIEDGYDIIMNNKNARRYSLIDDVWVDNSDEFEVFKKEDINQVSGYEDAVQKYTDKINNVVDNDEYKEALLLKEEIRQNRSRDLAEIGSLSMGNVIFKELRNNGSYGKLKDYLKSKELELGVMNE